MESPLPEVERAELSHLVLPAELGEGARAVGAELVVGHDDARHVRHPLGRFRQAIVVQLQKEQQPMDKNVNKYHLKLARFEMFHHLALAVGTYTGIG